MVVGVLFCIPFPRLQNEILGHNLVLLWPFFHVHSGGMSLRLFLFFPKHTLGGRERVLFRGDSKSKGRVRGQLNKPPFWDRARGRGGTPGLCSRRRPPRRLRRPRRPPAPSPASPSQSAGRSAALPTAHARGVDGAGGACALARGWPLHSRAFAEAERS